MLKIILADNQAIFRTGVAKVLAVEDDLRIVAQAENPEKMMMALEKFHASVLIFSADMHSNLHVVVETARKFKTKLVLVADNGQDSRHYMANGIHGVIYRNVSGEALVQCVRKVSKGASWVQDTNESKETAENDLVGARVRDRLTAKKLKIVALIARGYKSEEIATQLGTTEQVIKNYLRNVYDKIGVSDRLELALFTIHHRILNEAAAATAAAHQPQPTPPGAGVAS